MFNWNGNDRVQYSLSGDMSNSGKWQDHIDSMLEELDIEAGSDESTKFKKAVRISDPKVVLTMENGYNPKVLLQYDLNGGGDYSVPKKYRTILTNYADLRTNGNLNTFANNPLKAADMYLDQIPKHNGAVLVNPYDPSQQIGTVERTNDNRIRYTLNRSTGPVTASEEDLKGYMSDIFANHLATHGRIFN
jgi:hypothetical protein